MTAKKSRPRKSMAAVLADPRWEALASGTATPEEVADLRTWAEHNQYAAEAWEACRPATQEESAQLADELLQGVRDSRFIAEGKIFRLELQSAANGAFSRAVNESPKIPRPKQYSGRGITLGLAKSRNQKTITLGASHLGIATETIERAMVGESQSVKQVITIIVPIIKAAIAPLLLPRDNVSSRLEVDDICQEVVLALFAYYLKSWDPGRETFEIFVELIAKRKAIEHLRRGRELFPDMDVSRGGSDWTPEEHVSFKEGFDLLIAELSERGRDLFRLMFIEGHNVDEVCEILNMEPRAVYLWHSRFARRVEEIAKRLRKP